MDERLEVEIEGHRWLLLKRETWSKRNQAGQVVGSRKQFPIVLSFACMCHKTQGLTLPSAVIHCLKEFVPCCCVTGSPNRGYTDPEVQA